MSCWSCQCCGSIGWSGGAGVNAAVAAPACGAACEPATAPARAASAAIAPIRAASDHRARRDVNDRAPPMCCPFPREPDRKFLPHFGTSCQCGNFSRLGREARELAVEGRRRNVDGPAAEEPPALADDDEHGRLVD